MEGFRGHMIVEKAKKAGKATPVMLLASTLLLSACSREGGETASHTPLPTTPGIGQLTPRSEGNSSETELGGLSRLHALVPGLERYENKQYGTIEVENGDPIEYWNFSGYDFAAPSASTTASYIHSFIPKEGNDPQASISIEAVSPDKSVSYETVTLHPRNAEARKLIILPDTIQMPSWVPKDATGKTPTSWTQEFEDTGEVVSVIQIAGNIDTPFVSSYAENANRAVFVELCRQIYEIDASQTKDPNMRKEREASTLEVFCGSIGDTILAHQKGVPFVDYATRAGFVRYGNGSPMRMYGPEEYDAIPHLRKFPLTEKPQG